MTNKGDEEEESTTTPGRPNAWWQQERTGFSGDFRGVKEPKPGAQSVTADQILGDYDTCWCGEPMDHTWPGKANGRKHPKEQQVSAVAVEEEAPRIELNELRGFCDEYKELIIMAVNQYGVRYRMAHRRDTIILFPKDKAVTPFSLTNRFNANTYRRFQRWFARHVVVTAGNLVKDPEVMVEDFTKRAEREDKTLTDQAAAEAAAALAKKINNPVEHPAPEKKVAKKAVPTPPKKKSETSAYEVPDGGTVQSTETWVLARRASDNTEMTEVLTNGPESFMCASCRVYRATKADRVVSHYKTAHDPEHRASMYGDEARLRKAARLAETNLRKKISPAAEILMEVLGIEVGGDSKETERLKAELARTSAALEREIDARKKAEADRDDAKARLELMREALRA